jgi:hypothetical protein
MQHIFSKRFSEMEPMFEFNGNVRNFGLNDNFS